MANDDVYKGSQSVLFVRSDVYGPLQAHAFVFIVYKGVMVYPSNTKGVVLINHVFKKEPLLEGSSLFLFRFPNLFHIFKLKIIQFNKCVNDLQYIC